MSEDTILKISIEQRNGRHLSSSSFADSLETICQKLNERLQLGVPYNYSNYAPRNIHLECAVREQFHRYFTEFLTRLYGGKFDADILREYKLKIIGCDECRGSGCDSCCCEICGEPDCKCEVH